MQWECVTNGSHGHDGDITVMRLRPRNGDADTRVPYSWALDSGVQLGSGLWRDVDGDQCGPVRAAAHKCTRLIRS